MDITQTNPERKPTLADPAGRYLAAASWRRMARTLLTRAEKDVFGRVILGQQRGFDHWWGQITLALWCSDVASIIEGCKPVELAPPSGCTAAHHAAIQRTLLAWKLHTTPVGHAITVDDQEGKHITRIGLCDQCGERVEYTMTFTEAKRWLAGLEGREGLV